MARIVAALLACLFLAFLAFVAGNRLPPSLVPKYNAILDLINQNLVEQAQKELQPLIVEYAEIADTWMLVALALQKVGQIDQAAGALIRAHELRPTDPSFIANVGNLYGSVQRFEESIPYFRQAFDLGDINAQKQLAHVMKKMGRFRAAIQEYRVYLQATQPQFTYEPPDCVCMSQMGMQSDIHSLRNWRNCVHYFLHYDPPLQAIEPMSMLLFDFPLTFRAEIARYYSYHELGSPVMEPINDQSIAVNRNRVEPLDSTGRLRIGYISHDYLEHPVCLFLRDTFRHHDRSRFEIFAYSYGEASTPGKRGCRSSVEAATDHMVDVRNTLDTTIAQRIASDGIDILVDLTGHTFARKNSLAVMRHRPAPITVVTVGYPGFLNADYIDYYIADSISVLPEESTYNAEKVVYLPFSDRVARHLDLDPTHYNEERWGPSNLNISNARDTLTWQESRIEERATFSLPTNPGAIVFCSFNQPHKIDAVIYSVWMNVMSQVPGSALWLMSARDPSRHSLFSEAEAAGIGHQRVVFSDVRDKPYHMERMHLADIGLDTRLYTGHTTTTDCLWVGIPVVTCPVDENSSRVAASMVVSAGLGLETVSASYKEFEDTAVILAHSPEELTRMRTWLHSNRETLPLFDSERFTRNVETAYEGMWDRHSTGVSPESFYVPDVYIP